MKQLQQCKCSFYGNPRTGYLEEEGRERERLNRRKIRLKTKDWRQMLRRCMRKVKMMQLTALMKKGSGKKDEMLLNLGNINMKRKRKELKLKKGGKHARELLK